MWTLPRSGQLRDFYPRPPRGGRPGMQNGSSVQLGISIHALREEGDVTLRYAVWGFFISIHALREEGDRVAGFFFCHSANFYPRPPRGGRPVFRLLWLYHSIFLSTPSARRATHPYSSWERGSNISIHALREEGDRTRRQMVSGSSNFYPRPPRGGRPLARLVRADGTLFLSTPSARRATRMHHG